MEPSREAALADIPFQLVRPHLGELLSPLRGSYGLLCWELRATRIADFGQHGEAVGNERWYTGGFSSTQIDTHRETRIVV